MDRTLACGAGDRGSSPLGGTRIDHDILFRNGNYSIAVSSFTVGSILNPIASEPCNGDPGML